jgi:hypothetical protein
MSQRRPDLSSQIVATFSFSYKPHWTFFRFFATLPPSVREIESHRNSQLICGEMNGFGGGAGFGG